MSICWLEQSESKVPSHHQWLGANELVRLAGMRIPKRRADWRLGRWTAKNAVACYLNLPNLNLPNISDAIRNIEIRAASSGAPEVFVGKQPLPVAISLSHSSGTALCAIGPQQATFGCDVETIAPRSEAFIADYFTGDEGLMISKTPDEKLPTLLTVLWSAKESTLKALRVGLRVDTRSVSVDLSGDWQTIWQYGNLAATQSVSPTTESEMWHSLSVRCSGDKIFGGWWKRQGQLVRTVVYDPAGCSGDSPRALTDLLAAKHEHSFRALGINGVPVEHAAPG